VNEILVPWEQQSNTWWNEICAKVVEHFGLPGDRYNSHPSEHHMRFVFKNEKDAFMCRLMISESL
jgi:hypothetical protein